jgi:hypothetical protein
MSTAHFITIVCALRYAAARDTSAASLVCDHIEERLPNMALDRQVNLATQIVAALTENPKNQNTSVKLVLDSLWTSIKEKTASDDELRRIHEHITEQSACPRGCDALARLALPEPPAGS